MNGRFPPLPRRGLRSSQSGLRLRVLGEVGAGIRLYVRGFGLSAAVGREAPAPTRTTDSVPQGSCFQRFYVARAEPWGSLSPLSSAA